MKNNNVRKLEIHNYLIPLVTAIAIQNLIEAHFSG